MSAQQRGRSRQGSHRHNGSQPAPEMLSSHATTQSGVSKRNREYLPWSHRRSSTVRLLICVLCGIMTGAVGTIAHRMGASHNIPYGLVLALVIVGLSTWCARSRSGVSGLAWHLMASSATAWGMAVYSPGGGSLTPIGFGGAVPYFSAHVGYMWLYGMIVVQVVLLVCPSRWFVIEEPASSRHVPASPR